jgi:hypothetical protein
MDNLQAIEYGLGPAAILLLFAYHAFLFYKTRRDPMSTSLLILNVSRASRGINLMVDRVHAAEISLI